MGPRTPYVTDAALEVTGDVYACHHCGIETRVWPVHGSIVDPTLAADPELARSEPEVDEVCLACTLTGNIRKHDVDDMASLARRHATDPTAAMAAWQRTPNVASCMQGADWPLCCGDWCEFTGSPDSEEACLATTSTHRYWERGPLDWRMNFALSPESYSDISHFRCKTCQARWFIFQFT